MGRPPRPRLPRDRRAADCPAGGSLTSVWHLYLIECADGSLYTGIATDVERRFEEHRSGKGARYTRSHPPARLVASRPVGSRSAALKAELAIKRLPRDRKVAALLRLAPGEEAAQPA